MNGPAPSGHRKQQNGGITAFRWDKLRALDDVLRYEFSCEQGALHPTASRDSMTIELD